MQGLQEAWCGDGGGVCSLLPGCLHACLHCWLWGEDVTSMLKRGQRVPARLWGAVGCSGATCLADCDVQACMRCDQNV